MDGGQLQSKQRPSVTEIVNNIWYFTTETYYNRAYTNGSKYSPTYTHSPPVIMTLLRRTTRDDYTSTLTPYFYETSVDRAHNIMSMNIHLVRDNILCTPVAMLCLNDLVISLQWAGAAINYYP